MEKAWFDTLEHGELTKLLFEGISVSVAMIVGSYVRDERGERGTRINKRSFMAHV